MTGIVVRASGTSCGAPSRTKSFCMSTTSSAWRSGSSGKGSAIATVTLAQAAGAAG